jgi:hypothetical protein
MKSTDALTSSAVKDTKLEYARTKRGASPSIALKTRVGARKRKEKGNGSNKSRNSESNRKCTYCCTSNHDETAAAEKERNDSKHTADTTAKAARAETTSDSAPSSHNEERIRRFIAQQPAVRRTPAQRWPINSRASAPMTAHRNSFIAYRSLESPKRVWLDDERRVHAVGISQIVPDIIPGRATSRLIAQDILRAR